MVNDVQQVDVRPSRPHVRHNSVRGFAQAESTRDTLAQQLYERTFDFIVRRLNEELSATGRSPSARVPAHSLSILLLDMFGFESFKVNSFEQLCINYANERLQSQPRRVSPLFVCVSLTALSSAVQRLRVRVRNEGLRGRGPGPGEHLLQQQPALHRPVRAGWPRSAPIAKRALTCKG